MKAACGLTGEAGSARIGLFVVSVAFFVMHALLMVYDLSHPEAFVAGDRAGLRLDKIHYGFAGLDPDWPFDYVRDHVSFRDMSFAPDDSLSVVDRLTTFDMPGDYVVHGILYHIGGSVAVIVLQILLAWVAVLCVYRLALLLGQPRRNALIAAAIYVVLPGMICNTHQLVTEALYNPLVVIAFTVIVACIEERFRTAAFLGGLVALALAIFVRQQLLLYPLILALILAFHFRQRGLLPVAMVVGMCFLPTIGWMVFVYVQTGSFFSGVSDLRLGFNLSGVVSRMATIGGFPFDRDAYPGQEMPASAFFSYIADHPLSYLRLKLSETVNLLFNPGTYAVTNAYLDLFDPGEALQFRHFQTIRDREGLVGVIFGILDWGGGFALVFLGSALLWGLFLLGAVIGAGFFLVSPGARWLTKAVLASYVVYGLTIVQVSEGVRWNHRTSVEFVLVILFVIGVDGLLQRLSKFRVQRRSKQVTG